MVLRFNRLSNNYLKSCDSYEAEFACVWRAKDQLHNIMYAFIETWAFLMHSYLYMYKF